MSLHKIRPRKKQYCKFDTLKPAYSKTGQGNSLFRVYSPEINYLNSKWTNRLKEDYQNKLGDRQKIKFYFGFYRTALLKRIVRQALAKNKRLDHSLKELEFCSLLERRLDVLLVHLGFVPTLYAAKQLISHKKVKVNAHATGAFSRLVAKGDIISFDLSIHPQIQCNLKAALAAPQPRFLNFSQVEINFTTLKIIVLANKLNFLAQTLQYGTFLRWENIVE